MSMNKKSFILEECGASFYPEGINDFNRLFNVIHRNGLGLESIFHSSPGFIRVWRPSEGDWFWVVEFSVSNGKVSILFPWCQDWAEIDGVRLDKSIALCTNGASKKQLIDIFQKALNLFWDIYFAHPFHDCTRKLPEKIFSRTLKDGRRAVPEWQVDVRANLNPVNGGDMFISHLAARRWFEGQGYVII
jgi:hypothetical protein